MNARTNWQETNQDYLASALADLRARLEKMAEPAQQTPAPAPEKRRRCCAWFRRRAKEETVARPTETGTPVLPTGKEEKQIDEGTVQQVAWERLPSAMQNLAKRFRLSRFEQQVLLLCAAMELDTRIPALCAAAQGDPTRPYPTFALALALFDDPIWNALSPQNPLRHWRLIEINQPGATPLTASALRADERIVNYLKGLNYLDDRLAPFVERVPIKSDRDYALPPSQERQVIEILAHLHGSRVTGRTPVIELLGKDSADKRAVARRVAAERGVGLYHLSIEFLPTQWPELETFARLWRRESLLLPLALYVDVGETSDPASHDARLTAAQRFLARTGGIFFLDVDETQQIFDRPIYSVEVQKPTPEEQRAAWSYALGQGAEPLAETLAAQFNLSQQEIDQIAAAIPSDEPDRPLSDLLWDACLAASRPNLERLAQRIDTKATWDDIVLPKDETTLLRQISQQVGQRARVYEDWGFRQKMNRGLGISALFAGESGTGKTMAAEVIANDLKLPLYRIDLSAVVSKYIGETEKNLRRVFDAAEDSGAILFFDEADALFGKRSEVKDSHDRYANIEINYLLQRMEAHRGLAILATNRKSALDAAFLRRLRFIVNFPFPGAKERQRIWENVFPKADASLGLKGTPVEGLSYEQLAKLNLTGGSIHNVALNAAFLAAHAGTKVTMGLLLEAARTEFRKLERPFNEADIRMLEAVGTKG